MKKEATTIEERPFTDEEIGFRRGYMQGFFAGKHSSATVEEVSQWRYGDETTAPPGSGMAGYDFGDSIRK